MTSDTLTATLILVLIAAALIAVVFILREIRDLLARYLQILTTEMPEPNLPPETPVSARPTNAFVEQHETDRARAASSGYESENS